MGRMPPASAKTAVQGEQGILFTTYSVLWRAKKEKTHRPLEQIVNGVGADFEGVLALEECQEFRPYPSDASALVIPPRQAVVRGDRIPQD